MKHPREIINRDQLAALRDAGWIIVREDAIRLAQAMAQEELKERRSDSA